MLEEKIKRINELYHLSQERALTGEELAEQKSLRADYIAAIRASVKGQLSNIEIVEKDGSKHALVSLQDKKKEYRKAAKATRSSIGEDRRKEAEDKLVDEIRRIAGILKCKKILLYANTAEEVATDVLFDHLSNSGMDCFYPVTKEDVIEFYRVNALDELSVGTFQIREPFESAENLFIPEEETENVAILVPGLSFTRDGYRIGYGGGYYDRYLERIAGKSHIKTVGVCFKELISTNLPYGKNDKSVDFVIEV